MTSLATFASITSRISWQPAMRTGAEEPMTPFPEAHDLSNKFIRYGSSPRGAQALVECGQVLALMKGRLHLSIEDINAVAPAVLRHRIILNFDAHAEGQTAETILAKVIPSVAAAVPSRA